MRDERHGHVRMIAIVCKLLLSHYVSWSAQAECCMHEPVDWKTAISWKKQIYDHLVISLDKRVANRVWGDNWPRSFKADRFIDIVQPSGCYRPRKEKLCSWQVTRMTPNSTTICIKRPDKSCPGKNILQIPHGRRVTRSVQHESVGNCLEKAIKCSA